jgi:hypothetical protein
MLQTAKSSMHANLKQQKFFVIAVEVYSSLEKNSYQDAVACNMIS